MQKDSDPIKSGPDSLTSVMAEAIYATPYKLYAIMFILFLLISSDTFINRILAQAEGATETGVVTSWGTVLQGVFLVIAVFCVDFLIKQKII